MDKEKPPIQEGRLVYRLVTDNDGDPYIMIGVIVSARRYVSKEHPERPPYDEYDVRWFAGAPDDIVDWNGLWEDRNWYEDGDRRNDFELDPDIIAKRWTDWAVSTMADRLTALKTAQAEGRIITYPKQPKEEC